jgi:hypothetical protein
MAVTTLALNFLWKFLEPVLGDYVKERLKPKNSSTRARDRAFSLYQELGQIKKLTDDFVIALQAYAQLVAKNRPESIIFNSQMILGRAAAELMSALPKLAEAIKAVNPQLDIHQPELVQKIDRYRSSRAYILTELEDAVYRVATTRKETVQQLAKRAEKNRQLINTAIEEMRAFLAKEFPFKEGF